MDIPILFEDINYLVINKPSGLVVHSDGRTIEPAVTDWILEKYPGMKEVGEPWQTPEGETVYRPGIVHRLDRDTSGVLVIAKNQESFLDLKSQFQGRDIEKIYNAFVYGEMNEEIGAGGTIDRPIGKSRKDFRQWSAGRGSRGESRPAVTDYTVLGKISPEMIAEKLGTQTALKNAAQTAQKTALALKKRAAGQPIREPEQGASYIEARPQTGRTHQIRVHFKAINHPIIHDPLYAPKHMARNENTFNAQADLGFDRLALHARVLSFNGLDGKKITVEAPFPADFLRALEFLPKPLNSEK